MAMPGGATGLQKLTAVGDSGVPPLMNHSLSNSDVRKKPFRPEASIAADDTDMTVDLVLSWREVATEGGAAAGILWEVGLALGC